MGSELLVDGLNCFSNALDSLPFVLGDSSGYLGRLGNQLINVAQVALGLGFVIFVHELGHFLAAKTFGVRCDKFYIGFDVPISIGPIKFPRTLGKFTWGETEYGIGIIPLGGYVKMLGQDDDPRRQAEENAKIREAQSDDSEEELEDIPLDPRSYPAKPVWQRMVIISAGVVMNLIFAVILAGVAYRFGVPYTPAVAGSTFAGGPAWEAGIEPGEQIVRLGEQTSDNLKLRYNDFASGILMHGLDHGADAIPLTMVHGSDRRELAISPTDKYTTIKNFRMIGLSSASSTLVATPAFTPHSFLSEASLDLQPGDTILSINGEVLPEYKQIPGVLGYELTRRLQANWESPATIVVDRPGEEEDSPHTEVTLELPAVPVQSLGVGFEPGPVVAFRKGSVAQEAGVQVGDVIVAVNGEKVVNSLQLPSTVAQLTGQKITLTLRRGADAATQKTIDVEMDGPAQAEFGSIAPSHGALSLGGLGVAFEVSNVVSSVSERNAGSGVSVGDKLIQFQWIAGDEKMEELGDLFSSKAFKERKIDATYNVANLYKLMQQIPADSEIKCFFQQGKPITDLNLVVKSEDNWFWHDRGLLLSAFEDVHQTNDYFEAAQLGVGETSRRFTEVLKFLRMLVTGKIGAQGLGGPVAIVRAASGEADHGVSRLMLFLTLLSANLAILNFLPIPALDGGHMIFLIAEAIRGKPVNEALQIRLTMVGVLGLLGLMAFVIVNDIMRLVS